MPVSAARCLQNFKNLRAQIDMTPTNDPLVIAGRMDALMLAQYQAWVDELHANAQVSVTTNGSATTQTCTNGTIL